MSLNEGSGPEVIGAECSERAARSRPDARVPVCVLAREAASESRWASPPSPAGLLGTDGMKRAVGPVVFAKPL